MRITKRQLRRIVESSYEEIVRIRDSGDYEWQDMEYEVVDLMGSMQSIPAEDAIQIMYDALDAPNRSDEGFWQMMLSNGGNLYQALDGLKKTADEEYDPDIPVHEGRITTKVSKRQLRRIVREALLIEEEEDIDFNPDDLDLPLTPVLKKMLNPDIAPAKYAQLDSELDDSGNPAQQGFALAAFALSYADGDPDASAALLKKGITTVKKISQAKQKAAAKDKDPSTEESTEE